MSVLGTHHLPLFISKSFSSAASVVMTSTTVKRGQSQNSYILNHRMFHLLTSRPLPLFVSKSFSPATSAAATPAPSRAANLTILTFSPIECFVSQHLVPSISLYRRAYVSQHRRQRPRPPSRAVSLTILAFSPIECFVS